MIRMGIARILTWLLVSLSLWVPCLNVRATWDGESVEDATETPVRFTDVAPDSGGTFMGALPNPVVA